MSQAGDSGGGESSGGETVFAWVERLGALPERSIVEIARQMAAALDKGFADGGAPQAATPAQITVNRDGVARLTEPADPPLDSRHYTSPERVKGETEPDIRSEIYSLGASVYHMATGRAPFEGETIAAAMSKHVSGTLPWPSDVNPAISARLSGIIAKMMAKDPEERYRTPGELSLDLEIIGQGRDPVVAAVAPSSSTIAPAGARAKRTDRAGGSAVEAKVRTVRREHERPPGASAEAETPGRRRLPGPVLAPERTPSEPHMRHRDTERVEPPGGAGALGRRGRKKRLDPSEEARRRAEQAKLLAAIGSGVVVVVVLVAIAVFGGGAGSGPSSGRPGAEPEYEVARAVRAADELRAMDAMNKAKKYALDHPGEVEEVLERFKRALQLAGGTSLEEEVAAATQAHRARWKEAALAALAAAEEKARGLAAAGDYDAGSAALMELSPELSSQVGGELIEATTKLVNEGRQRIATALAEAEGFAEVGRPERARAKLKELDQIRFKVGLGEIVPRRRALLKRMAKAEEEAKRLEREARESAKEQLPALLARFQALVEAGDLAGACVLMDDSVAKKRLVSVAGALRAASRVARALEERRDIMLAAAREMSGEPFTLQALAGDRKGKLESASEQGLVLVTEAAIGGQTRHGLTWVELVPEEEDRLAEGWKAQDPDGHLACAIIALCRKDAGAAERALQAAGDHPLVPWFRERLEAPPWD